MQQNPFKTKHGKNLKAETKKDFSYVTQANSLKGHAEESLDVASKLGKTLKELKEERKKIHS